MQNQIALYLIFATGIILIIGTLLNSDYLLGPKKIEDSDREHEKRMNIRTPFLTRWINWLTGAKMYDENGKVMQDFDQQRNNRRILYLFLGIIIIILGIIALNSGKFS